MKKCKKCEREFEPQKGLVNYCSMKCRQSKEWTEDDKKKKSVANKNSEKVYISRWKRLDVKKKKKMPSWIISEKKKDEIIAFYNDGNSLLLTSKKFGYSKNRLKTFLTIRERIKNKSSSQAVIDWRKKAKLLLIEYKGGKCVGCGYFKSIRSMQFHHLDPDEKDFQIGGKSWNLERLKMEADKCILVCSNCHGEIHDGLRDNYGNEVI